MMSSLPYKVIWLFFILALVLLIPFAIIVVNDTAGMVDSIDTASPLNAAQKLTYLKHKEALLDDMVAMSFVFLAVVFMVSLLFSRRIMAPIKELTAALERLGRGHAGERLDYAEGDEVGEAARAFNTASKAVGKIKAELGLRRQVIELSPIPSALLDDAYVIKEVSPAFSGVFGYSEDELQGYGLFDLIEQDSARRIRRRLVEVEGAGSLTFSTRLISKSDGLVDVRLDMARIAEGVAVFLRDLRSESILKEALRMERENSEAIMDNTEDLLLIVDRDYTVNSANLALRVRSGRDIKGETCSMALHGEEDRCYLAGDICPAREVFESGKPFRTVKAMPDSEGNNIFYDIMAFSLNDSSGEVNNVVMSMRDVTERMRFEAEIDRKNMELTALNDISRLLSRSLNAESVYANVLDRICDLFGMDGGGIYFLDPMGRRLSCDFHKGLSSEFVKRIKSLDIGQDLPGKVAASLAPMVLNDMPRDPRSDDSQFKHSGITSFACVPVKGKEKLMGVFFLFRFEARAFKDDDESILGSISEMMGISFDNARLYGRMKSLYEQDRVRRSDEQRDLLNISSMLASSPDIDAVLGTALDAVKRSCWADMAWLLMLDGGDSLVMRSSTDPAFEAGSTVYHAGVKSMEGVCIERKEPLMTAGLSAAVGVDMHKRLGKYHTSACVPIYMGDRPLGAISMYYSGEVSLSEDELHFIQAVGSMFGVALERSRLFESAAIQRGMAETVLESIGDGVATLSPDGQVISMNAAAASVFGIGSPNVVGTYMASIISEDNENFEFREQFMSALAEAAGGTGASFEATLKRPDGSLAPVAVSCSPARGGDGSPVGAVYVLRDLSGKREVDRMKMDFVRGVSHEFRTPLTSIMGMTEMVLGGELDRDRSREYLEAVLLESKRLEDTVSSVLDVAQIESGSMTLQEGDVDLDELVRNVAGRFEERVSEHGASLTTSVSKGVLYKGDREKLKLLLGHLVENSLKYSDRGVSVSVNVEVQGDMLVISVTDTGWGIMEDELPRLGERFFRGSTPDHRKGIGLGLAISRDICAMHGGTLEIQSTQGEGTVARALLPMRRDN